MCSLIIWSALCRKLPVRLALAPYSGSFESLCQSICLKVSLWAPQSKENTKVYANHFLISQTSTKITWTQSQRLSLKILKSLCLGLLLVHQVGDFGSWNSRSSLDSQS